MSAANAWKSAKKLVEQSMLLLATFEQTFAGVSDARAEVDDSYNGPLRLKGAINMSTFIHGR